MSPESGQFLTFLFTDLEGSTRLWEQFPELMRPALARHDELLRAAIDRHSGAVVKTTGDGCHAVFGSAGDGVAAALTAQQLIAAESWPAAIRPLRVRIGLHTGPSQERDGDFYGPTVNQAARIMSAGHGGQILLSAATVNLAGTALPAGAWLVDLGEHQLRDLTAPQQLFQLNHADLAAEFPPLKSLAASKHNLPAQLTSFVGRERELARVLALLTQTRLLTLLGPGGTGKTRLMLQAAAQVIDDFPDGVWLVDLAPLSDPDLLVDQFANALNLREQPGRSLLDSLLEFLRLRHLLILVDNVEHLVTTCAPLVERILGYCPQIKLLVTGRESLFIGGETTMQIPSLSLPAGDPDSLAAVSSAEAVQLFVERAQSAQPNFTLTPENSAAVVEIVRRLDGIPLALELAAARLRVMAPAQIAARLNNRFRLLTGGRRTALPRQQTLQALIDWSWNLLDDDEKALLRRLSVFVGGWTIAAAEAVTSSITAPNGANLYADPYAAADAMPLDVLEGLSQLVHKSLVNTEQLAEGKIRYHMLESIRQYARDRLFAAGEGAAMRDRHTCYFVGFVSDAKIQHHGPDAIYWLALLARETDNVRAAIEWARESAPLLALRLVGRLFVMRLYSFTVSESRRWLEQTLELARQQPGLERPEHQIDLGVAQSALSAFAFGQGHLEEGIRLGDEAVATLSKTDATFDLGYAYSMKGFALGVSGDWRGARVDCRQALAVARRHNHTWIEIMALGTLAQADAFAGDFQEAAVRLEEVKALNQKFNNPWLNGQIYLLEGGYRRYLGDLAGAQASFEGAYRCFEAHHDRLFTMISRSEISHLMRRQGKLDEALPHYRETIRHFQEMQNHAATAHQLECFAYIALARRRPERAARLLGAAGRIRADWGARSILEWELKEMADALQALAAQLGEADRDRLLAAGRALSEDEAVALAMAAGEADGV